MTDKELKLKVFKNKRNSQLLILLSKRKLNLKKKMPKFLKIKKEDLIF